jgi:hypothetical protein
MAVKRSLAMEFKVDWAKLCEMSVYREWAKAACIILESAPLNGEMSTVVKLKAHAAGVKLETYRRAVSSLRKHGLVSVKHIGFQGAWWISSTPKGYLYAHPQIAEGAGLGGQQQLYREIA